MELSARAVLLAAEALQPAAAATVIRRAGERAGSTITGPFAETTEQLGAVYLLDCADAAEARAMPSGSRRAMAAWWRSGPAG